MLDGSLYIECDCGTFHHTVRFVIDHEDHEVYIDYTLIKNYRLHKRIWYALKYIFGSELTFEGSTILNRKQILRLKDFLECI